MELHIVFFQGKLIHIKLSYDWALCIRRLKKNKKLSSSFNQPIPIDPHSQAMRGRDEV